MLLSNIDAVQALPRPDATFIFDDEIVLFLKDGRRLRLGIKNLVIGEGLDGRNSALRTGSGESLVISEGLLSSTCGSLVFWARPEYPSNSRKRHSYFEQGTDSKFRLIDSTFAGWGGHTLFLEIGQIQTAFPGTNFVETSAWNHIAVIWQSGPEGFVRIHLNGEQIINMYTDTRITPFEGPLFVGGQSGSGNVIFDLIKVFNAPLSPTEVNEIFLDEKPEGFLQSKWQIKYNGNAQKLKDPLGNLVEARLLYDIYSDYHNDIKKAVEILKTSNMNVFVPFIWHGDLARWRSSIDQMHPEYKSAIVKTGADPLKTLISHAHNNKIEVHAGFTIGYRVPHRNPHPEFTDPSLGPWSYNLHNSTFREHIVSLINEVIEQYSIDGIHLDYVRTKGICRSPDCQKQYFEATARDLLQDIESKDRHFLEWQANVVDQIVNSVSILCKRRGLILSVDTFPNPPGQLNEQGRNHSAWLNEGLIDLALYMNYSPRLCLEEIDYDKSTLENPNRGANIISNHDPGRNHLVKISRPPSKVCELIEFCRTKYPGIVGIYNYREMTREQAISLSQGPFQSPAVPNWQLILSRGR